MAARRRTRLREAAEVPRQRVAEQVVLAVLRPDESPQSVVRLAARAAHDEDLPLHIALTPTPPATVQRAMAVMDDALGVARECSPGLQVSVSGPFGAEADFHAMHDRHVRLVVSSVETRQTFTSIPDFAWLSDRRFTVL